VLTGFFIQVNSVGADEGWLDTPATIPQGVRWRKQILLQYHRRNRQDTCLGSNGILLEESRGSSTETRQVIWIDIDASTKLTTTQSLQVCIKAAEILKDIHNSKPKELLRGVTDQKEG
jgi:hypothetical protein